MKDLPLKIIVYMILSFKFIKQCFYIPLRFFYIIWLLLIIGYKNIRIFYFKSYNNFLKTKI